MRLVGMLIVAAAIVVGGFVAFGLYLYLAQDRMVFFPTRVLEATPADIGLRFEDLMLESAGGEHIHAWYVPASSGKTSGDSSSGSNRPTVIFCHGNGGNISHRLSTIEMIHQLGADLLLFDYRGYGRSEGTPSEDNMYADADACYRYLVEKRAVPPARLVWFGRSLGGAVAVEMAVRRDCGGLIVESSFTSAREMGRRMFPYYPIGLLLRYKFDSIGKVGRVNCPILVTHSRHDDVIPYEMGRHLFKQASEPKRFLTFVGDHNAREYMADPEYSEAMRWILDGGEAGHPQID